MPSCVACREGVDWLCERHWHHARRAPEHLEQFLHDNPRCVTLVYPGE